MPYPSHFRWVVVGNSLSDSINAPSLRYKALQANYELISFLHSEWIIKHKSSLDSFWTSWMKHRPSPRYLPTVKNTKAWTTQPLLDGCNPSAWAATARSRTHGSLLLHGHHAVASTCTSCIPTASSLFICLFLYGLFNDVSHCLWLCTIEWSSFLSRDCCEIINYKWWGRKRSLLIVELSRHLYEGLRKTT
jgi:hypothetical protein